jgi:predicted Zn-dependent protease
MLEIQDVVEQALAASGADGCIVIGSERSETNLRWANNSLTTNGQMAARDVTVVSTLGTSVGSVSRSVDSTA